MQAARNTHSLQRLVLNEFLADDLQNLHGLVRPFNTLLAQIGEVQVLDVTIHLRRCGSHASPVALKEICRIYCRPSLLRKSKYTQAGTNYPVEIAHWC